MEWSIYSGRARGVSADGEVVVGWTPIQRPVRRTAAGGVQLLPLLPGGGRGDAAGVSGDGLTVAGWSESSAGERAVLWPNAASSPVAVQDLGTLPGADSSFAYAISSDGTTVVGWARFAGTNRAFRWSAAGGMEDLGVLPGMTDSMASAVNSDGSVILGGSFVPGGPTRAVVWTRPAGMQELSVFLQSRAVDLTGWVLDHRRCERRWNGAGGIGRHSWGVARLGCDCSPERSRPVLSKL
jgi:probable HAF family extracellular repeat protein